MEIVVALEWNGGSGAIEQDIIHEMADSAPSVSASGDVVEVSWTIFPMGAGAETTVVTCWSLKADRSVFVEKDCDR